MTRFVSVEVDDDGRMRVEAEGFTAAQVARFVETFSLWEAKPEVEVAASPKAAKPAPKPKARFANPPAGSHTCDVEGCGRVFTNPHGLTVHKARSHKAAQPEQVTSIAPPGDWRLRCEDCDYTTDPEDLKGMRQHTMTDHGGRLPSTVERTPSVA